MVSCKLDLQNVITKNICIPFKSLGRNILELLQETIVNTYEQSCIKEGYIKANSIRILNYSSGRISGENVLFNVPSLRSLSISPLGISD